ncbi:hypothetical protein CIPAW_12G105000 [Carya illinoinensis]|uniref:CAF17 C-terminal domain-containing protein n=1 Tax=Carya illinoinensis TaxID=32201 RepID=A0A8T1NZT0_CARIL|nr:hypothetical protein CIPAW_12G105000 [Carya illinoinensis]
MHLFRSFLRFPKSTAFSFVSNRFSHLETAGPPASILKSQSVVRFRGADTVKFLQGLLTNDVRRLDDSLDKRTSTLPTSNLPTVSVPPVYAALLTPQGRFLHDLFLYRPPRPDAKLDRNGSEPGSHSDESFELFADVDATNLAEDFSCWQLYGGNLSERSLSAEEPEAASVDWGGGVDHSGMSASCAVDLGWQWFKDPRLDSLGFRGIFPSDITCEANPLEYNLAGLSAISFDKGCHLGQELVARTHPQGVIRKHLLPLKFLNDSGEVEQKVAPGSDVLTHATHKKVGTVTTTLGCRGLGLLRLDEAFRGPGILIIQGQEDVKVEAIRPDWWPAEWFQEHQQYSGVS